MILVSGSTRTVARVGLEYPGAVGHLLTPGNRNAPASLSLTYAADNGCYHGFHPDAFTAFLGRLARAERKPLWVCAPDVVGGAECTLDYWPRWMMTIAAHGLEPAFVLQDGMQRRELPGAKAFFVGGTTKWKLSGHVVGLAEEIKGRGAWLHVGRVNTLRRLRFAHEIGADSVDGSCFSRWADKFLLWAVRYVARLERQPMLFQGGR